MATKSATIAIENVNHPGQVQHLDAGKYNAMKRAVLKVLPKASPGLTIAQAQHDVLAHLPDDLFPDGSTAGWWMKAVQLDLEAKGIIAREKTKPLRLRKA